MIDRYNAVKEIIFSQKDTLNFTPEDEKLILKLWEAYWKKTKGYLRGDPQVLAAAVLWRYSSDNYLWEHDKILTQKSLAGIFNVRGKTIGNNASEIRDLLKINLWDDRFCRKSVAESNPMKSMAMLPSGFIVPKEMALEKGLPFAPLKKDKADYYYDGCDWLDAGQEKKAVYCFKKALEMDDEYVEAWNGLGTAYWFDNFEKAKEHISKAYDLTVKKFKGVWLNELPWEIMENRQYLRAIHYMGLVYWREGNNDSAMEMFKLMLKLNPNDNQGARYLIASLYAKQKWEDVDDEDRENEEKLLEEQNAKYKFWEWKEK
ncbi:MAG: DUF6398 domain-containing protein [Nanoarchaeota archaeon]